MAPNFLDRQEAKLDHIRQGWGHMGAGGDSALDSSVVSVGTLSSWPLTLWGMFTLGAVPLWRPFSASLYPPHRRVRSAAPSTTSWELEQQTFVSPPTVLEAGGPRSRRQQVSLFSDPSLWLEKKHLITLSDSPPFQTH